MTHRTSPSPGHAPRFGSLSKDDAAALKRSYSDFSDLDERTKARAKAGFQHAYAVAERVVDGRVDPMSV